MADNSGIHNKTLTPNKTSAPNGTQQLPATEDSAVSEVSMDHTTNSNINGHATGSNTPSSGPATIENSEAYSVVPVESLQMLDNNQQKKVGNNLDATKAEQEAMDHSFSTASMHSDTSSLEDSTMEELPLSDRMSIKEEVTPRRSHRQKVPVDKDFPSTRRRKQVFKTSPSDINPKKARISKNSSFKKMIESDDKDSLLEMLLEEVGGKKIVEAYKKNGSTKEIQEQLQKVFKVRSTKDLETVSLFKTTTTGYSKLLSKDVYLNAIMEIVGTELEASMVLKFLKPEQVKEAILKTITDKDLLGMLFKSSNPAVHKKMLEIVPDDAIIKQVESRDNLNASETLLNILLEKYSKIVPEEQDMDSDDPESVPVKSIQIALIDNVNTAIDSKPYLNKSEQLLNILLQKGPDVYSQETKENIKNVLRKKFSATEFHELSYHVTKSHLDGKANQLD